MSQVKVHIEFIDGTIEITDICDSVNVRDQVLHVYYMRYNSTFSASHHLGSWPLVNIKKWWTEPA
jgi:hypothetical protein